MRPPADLGERARNWFWYGRVRTLTDRSNDQLDALFLAGKSSGRRRHFQRIYDTGCSPALVAVHEGSTLLKRVDAFEIDGQRPFTAAKIDFESDFWDHLRAPGVAVSACTAAIAAHARRCGWHRLPASDVGLYVTVLGEDAPCVQPVGSMAFSAMLHRLVNDQTLESLAILAALFREARHGVLLEEAMQIQRARRAGVALVSANVALPERGARLLWQLVNDRILSNWWVTIADWPETTRLCATRSTRQRARDLNAFIDWYLSPVARPGRGRFGTTPLVPASARIAWLEDNRPLVEASVAYYHSLRQDAERWRFQRPDHADALLAQAGEVLAALGAPTASAADLFYVARPPIELGPLPAAYPEPALARADRDAQIAP